MNQSTSHPSLWLYAFVIISSLVLSSLELIARNPLELDSLLYIKAAELFQEEGITGAMRTYGWPFFSMMLAKISQLTTLSLVHAGYLLNAALQALIAVNFVRIIKVLRANQRTLWFAAITILFYPYLNKIRPYITRDFGYWAFALGGLHALLRYQHQPRWRDALSWNILMGTATLFRIEGAVFLLLSPLLLLLPSTKVLLKERLVQIIKLYAICFLPLVVIGALSWLHPAHKIISASRLSELADYLQNGVQTAWTIINAKSLIIGRDILTNISFDDSKWFLSGGLLSLFIVVFIRTLNPVYLFLSYYGIKQRLLPAALMTTHLLMGFIILNVLILLLFLAQHFFMVDRYVVFLNLLLMLWVPFSLEKLYSHWQQRRTAAIKSWLFPMIVLLMAVFALGGIVRFGYSKAYITEAGQWVKTNTPAQAKLYSNSTPLLFYAERLDQNGHRYYLNPPPVQELTQEKMQQYDYLAIWYTKTEGNNLVPPKNWQTIKIFRNKRGDKVIIYTQAVTPAVK